MTERRMHVGTANGLHARPIADIARIALAHGARVTVQLGAGDPVDAASILELMNLGAAQGDELRVVVDGDPPDAERVLDSIATVLASGSL